MFCEKCGKKNIKGAKYCEECGTKLESNIKKEVIKNKKILIIVAAIILSLTCIYTIISKSFKPENIAKKYFVAVMNADADKIYDYLDLKEEKFTTKKIFKNVYSIKKQDLINYSISSVDKSDDGLTATVKINYTLKGNAKSESANINLIKDKNNKYLIFDNWQISDKYIETVKNFELTAPKNSKVTVEGILLDKKYKQDSKTDDVYKLPELFKGNYKVNVTLKNGLNLEDDISVTSAKNADLNNLNISTKDEKKLQKNLPDIIEKLYEYAIEEKPFEEIKKEYDYDGADLKDLESSYNSFMKAVSAGGLKTFKVKKLKINNTKFDDSTVKVTADVDFDYTATYKVLDKEKNTSGNNDDIMYFYFDYKNNEFKLVNISSMAKFFI